MTTLLAFSVFYGFSGGADAPSKGFVAWQDSLRSKTSISAKVAVQEVGGSAISYSIDMKKPNLLRLDSDTTLIIADGTNITTFDKKQGVYYKQPQTKEDLRVLLDGDQYNLFNGFFGTTPNVLKSVDGQTRSLGGDQVIEVNTFFDKGEKKKQLKRDEKAHEAQAKADKLQRKALDNGSIKEAEKAQDKAEKAVAAVEDSVEEMA